MEKRISAYAQMIKPSIFIPLTNKKVATIFAQDKFNDIIYMWLIDFSNQRKSFMYRQSQFGRISITVYQRCSFVILETIYRFYWRLFDDFNDSFHMMSINIYTRSLRAFPINVSTLAFWMSGIISQTFSSVFCTPSHFYSVVEFFVATSHMSGLKRFCLIRLHSFNAMSADRRRYIVHTKKISLRKTSKVPNIHEHNTIPYYWQIWTLFG